MEIKTTNMSFKQLIIFSFQYLAEKKLKQENWNVSKTISIKRLMLSFIRYNKSFKRGNQAFKQDIYYFDFHSNFNQVFQRKTLVINLMYIGGRVGGRASRFRFRIITRQPFKLFNCSWSDYRTGQCGVSLARMTTLFVFIF